MLRFYTANDLLFSFLLVLDELDIRHLTSWRWWDHEEKREDKTGEHHRNMEDVRTACRLGHLQNALRIKSLAMNEHCVVVRIAHSESNIENKHADDHQRRRTSYMHLLERMDELEVRLHVSRLAKFHEPLQKRISRQKHYEDSHVDCRYNKEEHALALLTVVELPQPRNDGHHRGHVGIAWGIWSMGC